MIVKRTVKQVKVGDLLPGDVFRQPGLGDVYFLRGESDGDDDYVTTINLATGVIDTLYMGVDVEVIVGAFVEGAK